MHCTEEISRTATAERTILLVGNPNVGKSVLFSKLTGKYVTVSNHPGTTVEIARGEAAIAGDRFTLLDTPGINELAAHTGDAQVTCDVLRDYPDATIVQVADAKNLRRALLLTLQLAELERPTMLVLNMMDELDKCGGRIDVRKLSELLGVPVVPTLAPANTGIELLRKSLAAASSPRQDLSRAGESRAGESRAEGRSYQQIENNLSRANEILAEVYTNVRPRQPTFAQKLGWWATHPFKEMAMLIAVLYVTFWFVGLLGAGTSVGFLENVVFARHVSPWAIRTVDAVLPFPHTHVTQRSDYKFEIPLTPTRGILLRQTSRDILAPTYSLAPGATPGGWTQARRLAHDFLAV